MTGRPTVSVIVPFRGSVASLEALLVRLASLQLEAGDEVIVADNRRPASRPPTVPASVRVCPTPGVRAPGFARNSAAGTATGEWLVFVDADTRPAASLLDDYFDRPPAPTTAVLAGAIVDVAADGGVAARHSVARGHMSQRATLERAGSAYVQTANCAVRRRAFAEVGGFTETIRWGEDADLCFRLARAGWGIEERPRARVEHRTRATVRGLLAQLAGHGSGAAWLNRRYPGEFPPLAPRELAGRLARAASHAARAVAHGESEQAAFALLDLATTSAFEIGRRLSNRARGR